MGRYRLHVRGEIDPAKQYLVQLEYTWNRQVIRKGMNIFVRLGDWNEKANKGRGGVRASYGPEANRINSLLLARVDKIDSLLAEFQQKHPNQITEQVISDLLADKPLTREDKGKDFIEFVQERLESDYSRNRIGRSRYENGKSGMNIFRIFLRATKNGTYKPDSIYLGEISVELIDEYIRWRREIKQNSDATINHALTPILKACAYASEMKMIDHAVNARIQDMRIASKISLADEDVNFEKKELRKIMIKTNKRHVIPLTEPALHILHRWQEKRAGCRYVFNLVKDDLDLDDAEALYKSRNNATKCINQSLAVVRICSGIAAFYYL